MGRPLFKRGCARYGGQSKGTPILKAAFVAALRAEGLLRCGWSVPVEIYTPRNMCIRSRTTTNLLRCKGAEPRNQHFDLCLEASEVSTIAPSHGKLIQLPHSSNGEGHMIYHACIIYIYIYLYTYICICICVHRSMRILCFQRE